MSELWFWFLVILWSTSAFLVGNVVSDILYNRRLAKAVQPLLDYNEKALDSRDYWKDECRNVSWKYRGLSHRRYQESDEDALIRYKSTLTNIVEYATPDARDERDVMVGKLVRIKTEAENALE